MKAGGGRTRWFTFHLKSEMPEGSTMACEREYACPRHPSDGRHLARRAWNGTGRPRTRLLISGRFGRRLVPLEVKLLHPVQQRAPRDVEERGGAGLVPVVLLECGQQEFALHVFE